MVYVFDLDGCICSHEKDYHNANPFYDRIEKINKLYDEGHVIIINTARGSTTKIHWYDITKNQLDEWGLKYDKLIVGKKSYYDFWIDDKAINDKDFFNETSIK